MEKTSGRTSEKTVRIELPANLENQGLARAFVAAFVSEADPTVEELTEIKTAVSEAFSNAVMHGYKESKEYINQNERNEKTVVMILSIVDLRTILIKIQDFGVGIEDIEKAMEPMFTTHDGEECSGMGFTVMESFMDRVEVDSSAGEGTSVTMVKKLDTYYGL